MKKIIFNGIDEIIYYDKSINGLPVYIWQNEKKTNYSLSLNVKFGSIDTDYKSESKTIHSNKGLAHYLEHLKFNEKGGKSANEFFEKSGSYSNAFTTFDFTSYEVSSTSAFKENLNHLLDFVLTPYFTNTLVNKERGIITEEIKMGEDNPYNTLYYGFNNNIFNKYNYKYEVAGKIEDIKKITLEEITQTYNTFYNPNNMFLAVSGNVNPYEAMEIVNHNLSNKSFSKYIKPQMLNITESPEVNIKEEEIKGNVEVPKVKIGVKLKKSLFKDITDTELSIISSIILKSNFGNTSEFKEFLLNNHIVEYIGVSRDILKDYLILSVTFESHIHNEALKIIKEKLTKLEIDENTISRRIKSNIASLILTFDSVDAVASLINSDIMQYGKINNDIYDIYKNITYEKVKYVLEKIKTDKNNLTVLKLLPNK